VVLAHAVVELAAITAIQPAELRVLIALGMLFFVLLPQQIQGEIEVSVGFELPVDVLEVR
jgi:hypothetical protein